MMLSTLSRLHINQVVKIQYLQKLCISSSPSITTSVLLKKLPHNTTNESLVQVLSEMNCRKILLEPGCALHLTCEAQADYAVSIVKNKLQCEVCCRILQLPKRNV